VRNPEFQLVAWTIKFYVQIETRTALAGRPQNTKDARTAVPAANGRPRKP
jgi:hypothetical protein